jgi:hypothetical protein
MTRSFFIALAIISPVPASTACELPHAEVSSKGTNDMFTSVSDSDYVRESRGAT